MSCIARARRKTVKHPDIVGVFALARLHTALNRSGDGTPSNLAYGKRRRLGSPSETPEYEAG